MTPQLYAYADNGVATYPLDYAAGQTTNAAPAADRPAGFVARIAAFGQPDSGWKAVRDWRDATLYRCADGQPVTLSADGAGLVDWDGLGALPVGYTEQSRPSAYHVWQQDGWWLDAAGAARQLADSIAVAIARVDDHAATTYAHWTRFEAEYAEREAAARHYRDAAYQGEPGSYLASYAAASAQAPQAAADSILTQAERLREAQAALAALRMRKYELARQDSVDAVATLSADLLAAMDQVVREFD
ncbi:hypothetical protein OL229_21625 [Neisseriaceae bacterium JH1-16]|nr:hypothetical protein [Neisseriaceae bacterium JH1-16]